GNYQVGNTFLNAGGVNFYLGVLPVDVASTAVVQVGGSGDETHTFATNIAVGSGATLYTLINSAFGGAGSDLGYVQVTGAGGETASLEL
ncbi:hypothetical protein, partial [Klebsiella pneumoniae]|uniref:hypothetical protein n=1 Tax=Klebsiella pneumoniae TaxID=573 RepID=UPI003CEB9A92